MQRPILRSGFTLIEVLFAVFIIAGALVVFAGVMMGSTRQARAGSHATQVVFAATEVLELEAANLKNGGAASLTCGASGPTARTHGGTEYTLKTDVTKLRLDAASGDLLPVNCAEPEPDAYEIALVLAWTQDGVSMTEEYGSVVAANTITAPSLDHFRTETGGHTAFIANPGEATALEWQTTIGTQPLRVELQPAAGTAVTGLRATGSQDVTPLSSQRYTLSAENLAGGDSKDVVVFVDDIDITDFKPHAPYVGPDEPIELTWNYTAPFDPEYEEAELNGANVGTAQEWSMPPVTANTNYELVVNTPGEVDGLPAPVHELARATTGVRYAAAPVIDEFTVTPPVQCRAVGGNLVNISWRVYAAQDVTLAENGATIHTAHEGSEARTIHESSAYELRGVNALGAATADAKTAAIYEYPTIDFTANRLSIVDGTAVNLTWLVTDASSVTLDGATVGLNDNAWFEPITPTTYVLVAVNGVDCVEQAELTIAIEPIDFKNVTLTPSPITLSETSTLSWEFTNDFDPAYHQVLLSGPDIGTVDVTNAPGWSYDLTPATVGAHEYRLELRDRNPDRRLASRTTTLEVIAKPEIGHFNATRAEVCEGMNTVLSWTTTNAVTARLLGVGPMALSGNLTVSPSTTTTYTLVAENELGFPVEKELTVNHTPNPIIQTFAATPNPVPIATPVELTWAVIGASNVNISNLGGVSSSGAHTFVPDAAGATFQLTARTPSQPEGLEWCETVSPPLEVEIEPIVIEYFGSDYEYIPRRGDQELKWRITPFIDPAYHRVTIRGDMASTIDVTADTTDGTPGTGSRVVTTTAQVNQADFWLDVRSRNGGDLLASAQLGLFIVQSPELRKNLGVTPTEMCAPGGNVRTDFEYRYGTGWLTWTGNSTPVELGTTQSPPYPGTYDVNIDRATEFTLTVVSPAGETVSDSATVIVRPKPVVNSFTASKTRLDYAGEPVTLTWSTSGAESVTLNGSPVLPGASREVYPTETTTYTLVVETAACGPQTHTVTVEVPEAPKITKFAAANSHTRVGNNNTLSWTLKNYNPTYHQLRLTQVSSDTTLDVSSLTQRAVNASAAGPHEYRLEIQPRQGSTAYFDRAVVSFNAGHPPTISNPRVNNPYTCSASGSVTRNFAWSTSNATSVTLNGATVPLTHSAYSRSVRAGQTWTLVASNPYGSVSRAIPIYQGTIPSVTSLSSSISNPYVGQTYNIRWTTSGATSLTVNGTPRGVNSSFNVTPSSAGNVSYSVVARSAHGCTATRSLTVNVRAAYLNMNVRGFNNLNYAVDVTSSSAFTRYSTDFSGAWPPGNQTITKINRYPASTTIIGDPMYSGSYGYKFASAEYAGGTQVLMDVLVNDHGTMALMHGVFMHSMEVPGDFGSQIAHGGPAHCALRALEVQIAGSWYTLVVGEASHMVKANNGERSRVIRTGTPTGIYPGRVKHTVNARVTVRYGPSGRPDRLLACDEQIVNGVWTKHM